uniref:Putative secreted protein n=1 Tax=Ixodes ricinus TaxID=34613 RepID=A0A090XES1_IXORI
MLLLWALLVVLISEIESGSTPSAMKTEDILKVLGSTSSLENHTDSSHCRYQELLDITKNIENAGFLAINCQRSCPNGKQTMVEGYGCIFKIKHATKRGKVKVKEGSCRKGACVRGSTRPPWRLLVLLGESKEEEFL